MCMVRSPKSSAGAVGAPFGNAPYGDGDLLRSAFGIALKQSTTRAAIIVAIVLKVKGNKENLALLN
ncbi:hypothetical protein H0902_07085 [Microcystis aeruginosa BLCCF108]|uniref:Uncharacterized protein n=1 Tax=Microcystis aeruginosa BLCC-F108 TaxID=2755317 RepID=A0A841UPQ3_MICAE|nr:MULTISPECIES: hypothetical protein [Microcystis]MBC1190590.1 hypothetical protein [Microcystis aeruginosa BLCC-F108]MCA2592874.1 hypothetical protein [Microcystis sp. M31BS1]